MKLSLITIILFLSLGCVLAQDADTLTAQEKYQQVWDTAMLNSEVSPEERALLRSMARVLAMPADSVRSWESQWSLSIPTKLDQTGRWPLVLQNMAIGAGLYGWGVPYVLRADDGRWYVGGVMMSMGSAFYLTYKYTHDIEMSHARTQMMRYGSLLGLRYGLGMNTLLELDDGLDDYYYEEDEEAQKRETLWVWTLMGSVPLGHYAGEWLYEKYQPSNGQAWAWTMWTAASGLTARLAFAVAVADPYEEYDSEFDRDWREREKRYEEWRRKAVLIELLTYPIGAWQGYHLVKDKNYSFGDALMLLQGWGYGFNNTLLLQSMLTEEEDEDIFLFLGSLGALGHAWYYDRWIAEDDFSFGQSTLMLLGSGSGIAFGFGLAIIMNADSDDAFFLLGLTGYGTGTWLTRQILDVKPDGALSGVSKMRAGLAPTILPGSEKGNYVPGLELHISLP